MFEKNQILYMRFQCIDMYGCPKLLDMDLLLEKGVTHSAEEGQNPLAEYVPLDRIR